MQKILASTPSCSANVWDNVDSMPKAIVAIAAIAALCFVAWLWFRD